MSEYSLKETGLDSFRGMRISLQGSTAVRVEIAEEKCTGESIVSYRRP